MLFTPFQKPEYAAFAPALIEAEQAFAVSPALCALSCRRALEVTVKFLYTVESMQTPYSDELNALISNNEFKKLMPNGMMPRIDYIRRLGNLAAHTGKAINRQDAVVALGNLFELADLIDYNYNTNYKPKEFDEALLTRAEEIAPPAADEERDTPGAMSERGAPEQANVAVGAAIEDALRQATDSLEDMRRRNEGLAEELARAKAERQMPAYEPHEISEYETRKRYIDLALKEAGWVLGENCIVEVPVVGMPFGTGDGYVDYVLYGADGKPLAVVEAKRTSRDARAGQQQAKIYADCLERMTGQRPVIYYTNGFDTWLWHDRDYPPRRVSGFCSPDDLKWMQDRLTGRMPLDRLPINESITNRYYQKEATRAVCDAFTRKQRKALLVMATGTGKTRTVISLADVLSRCGWVRNVLFLADRRTLVRQAKRHFKQHLPNMSLCNLVERDRDETPDARIVFSTYQTMMGAIDSERDDDGGRVFDVGHFDLIVVDEAHRSIYNKYAAIFDYFDALLVGLTATPRGEVDRDTYRIFELETGVPTYAFELDQAIEGKFLVPYHTVETKLKFLDEGIQYDSLSEDEKREYEEKFGNPDTPENLPPWIDPSALNAWLFNQNTVDRVLIDLMTKGQKIEGGDKLGKTILFARSQKHAEYIVERFDKLFPHLAGEFARVVHTGVNYVEKLIDDFYEPAKLPQIAVSVDMLDTGVDVPEVVNLVFFKKVLSKVKFWQMVGRGTRLCSDLFGPRQDKQYFLCFDYCNNFEFFRVQKKEDAGDVVLSLTERIFRLRVDIATELQALRWQDEAHTHSRMALVQSLANDINALNRDSFLVNQKLGVVEKYSKAEAWQPLTEVQARELKEELSPVLPSVAGDETARRFDVLLYRMELKHLRGQAYATELKQLLAIAEALNHLGTIPQVQMQKAVIETLLSKEFWAAVTLQSLEEVRQALRALVQFLRKGDAGHAVYTDFLDEVIATVENVHQPGPTAFANYRRKVETYIRQNQNQIAVHKLHTNQPLTDVDIQTLERILWDEVGTHEDYTKTYGEKPLGVLVREIVGLDQEAANEAFSQFLNDNDLVYEQMVYVKTIVDYVVRNGVLDLKALQEEPFRSVGSILSFPTEKGMKLVNAIKDVNKNAGLA